MTFRPLRPCQELRSNSSRYGKLCKRPVDLKTLVLGGYRNFGARICRAQSLAAELGGGAQGIAIDLYRPGLAQSLRELKVELLIHAAGPFQRKR